MSHQTPASPRPGAIPGTGSAPDPATAPAIVYPPAPPANRPVSLPDAATIRAYEQTNYLAEDNPPVCLRIGDDDLSHQSWLARYGARSASILTAWNPFGQELALAENQALQERLLTCILESGLRWVPARGEDPLGSWTPEPGFCVFDADPAQLEEWLWRFRQNAAVRLELGRGCRLVWHPEIARQMRAGNNAR